MKNKSQPLVKIADGDQQVNAAMDELAKEIPRLQSMFDPQLAVVL